MKTIPRLLFLACCNNSAQVSHLPEKEETFGGRPVFEFWFFNYELNGFGKPFLVLSYMSKKTSQTGWLKQTFFTVPEAGNSKIKVLAYLMSGYGPLNLSESSFLLCKMEIVIPHSYLIVSSSFSWAPRLSLGRKLLRRPELWAVIYMLVVSVYQKADDTLKSDLEPVVRVVITPRPKRKGRGRC